MTNEKIETEAEMHERMVREWIECERAELKSLPDGQTLQEAIDEMETL